MLPEDPDLAQVARELEKSRGAAVLFDRNWTLVWVSAGLKTLLDEDDPDKIGYGKHAVEVFLSDTWSSKVTIDSQMRALVEEFPLVIADTPGGKAAVADKFLRAAEAWKQPPDWVFDSSEARLQLLQQVFENVEPVRAPPVWVTRFDFVQGDFPPLSVTEQHVRLRKEDGSLLGTAILYDPNLPAQVLSLVARGDEQMFERMARLVEPGRRQAAVLFADLQMSTALSRRLPSAAYFRLIRELTTVLDQVVVDHKGIVGKHAGDGVTAFFLADDLGSASGAARAGVEAARAISVAAANAAKKVGEETGLIEAADCAVNVGAHWGGTLYMGQLVTGGRLEVTALGDEVNECARIQQSARGGEALASKSLIEQLVDGDAAALGLDPDSVIYRTLAELSGATDKAVRDAGTLPVTTL